LAREYDARGADAVWRRVRGDVLFYLNPEDSTLSEEARRAALGVAQQQGARPFAPQATLPLARLLQSTNRPLEAYEVLAAALEGFAPTPEMPAIAEAQALLETLRPR
jgi:hypothetical protein